MFAQGFCRCVHGHYSIRGPRCPRSSMTSWNRGGVAGCHPSLWMFAREFVQHTVADAAMRIPTNRVAKRLHVKWMKADCCIQIVIIPSRCMDWLRPADLFGGFSEEFETTFDTMGLHCLFGRKKSAQSPDA